MAFHSLPCPGRRSLYGIVDQIVIRGSHLEQTVGRLLPVGGDHLFGVGKLIQLILFLIRSLDPLGFNNGVEHHLLLHQVLRSGP